MASFQETKTPIEGVRILLNRVVSDHRGHFCDLAESDNPIFQDNLRHLHASIATQKRVARGGHYHHRLQESFYTLGGTALWILHDFRKQSPSSGKTYAVILGSKLPRQKTNFPVFTIDQGRMAQLIVPPGVYHAFIPLTEEPVVTFATGTEGYDPEDFARPGLKEIPGAEKILKEAGL